MELKPRLKAQLETIRRITEAMLSVFQTPEQWTHRVHDQANHALWCAGHLGTVDNFLLSRVAPEKVAEKEGYSKLFGMGSEPTSNPADYPAVSEVLAYMRERRQAVFEALDGLVEEDLAKPTPDGSPDFMPDFGTVFETAVWHESLHLGQVTVTRRALGHPPLAGPGPDSTS